MSERRGVKDLEELGESGAKELLINAINERPVVRRVMKLMAQNYGYDFALTLDHETWESRFDNDPEERTVRVRVGTEEMPDEVKALLFYQDEKLSETDILTYKLMHELAHLTIIFGQINPRIEGCLGEFRQFIFNLRKQGRGGLSTLGNFPHYRQKNPQNQEQFPSLEDMTELIAMSLFDQQYLQDYLAMLKSPDSWKQRLGLATLTGQEAKYIERVMSFLHSEFLLS